MRWKSSALSATWASVLAEDALGHGPPLGRVAVEQAVRLVAANDGGGLPAEVGRVDQLEAQPLAARRRVDVRRVPREQDAISR